MKHDEYYDPPFRLIDLVFVIGRFDIEGEPDDPKSVFVLDLHGDDRAKAGRINKRFFGGTATVTEWPAFEMVRLQCRSEKGLDRAGALFEKYRKDKGYSD